MSYREDIIKTCLKAIPAGFEERNFPYGDEFMESLMQCTRYLDSDMCVADYRAKEIQACLNSIDLAFESESFTEYRMLLGYLNDLTEVRYGRDKTKAPGIYSSGNSNHYIC